MEKETFDLLAADYFRFEIDGSFPNGLIANFNFIREYYPYSIYKSSKLNLINSYVKW
jgi:hypothetical protein